MNSVYVEIKHDDVLTFTDEEGELEFSEDGDMEEIFEATPVWIYLTPIQDSVKVDVNFNPKPIYEAFQFHQLHVVFVRYVLVTDDGNPMPRWEIATICETRREAKQIAEAIEEDVYTKDPIWKQGNSYIEDIEVYSLGVEN